MTTYTYLGYGTTDSNGVAKLDHDANGDAISHSYTGTGAGKIDVVASLEDISDLTINVNPSTINDNTSGTTHSISATVLKDGAAVQNENVTFELRKQSDNTLVETFTGTTNSSGIATVSYSGKHSGLLYIRAFCGTVVSQPYNVWDCFVKDNCTTDTNIWTSSTVSFDRTSGEYMQCTGSGSSNSLWIEKNSSSNLFDYTKDWAFEFDCINANTCGVYINVSADRKGGTNIPIVTEFTTIRVEYDATNQKIKLFKNGTQEDSTVTLTAFSTDFSFRIMDWQGDLDMKMKNFKVYPI